MKQLAFFVLVTATGAAHAATPVDAAKVDKGRPQETALAPPEVLTPDFTQEAQATVGALFNDGNTSALSGKASGYWQMKYLVHGVRLELGAGVAALAQDPDGDPANGFGVGLFDEQNRANTAANALARYDFFVTRSDSIYAAGLAFHDSAANLLARLRADVGYRHFLINQPKHTLTTEVGAVYTIDDVPVGKDDNLDGRVDIGDKTAFEKSGGTYAVRFAAAYTNAITSVVAYSGNFEIIPNVFPAVDAPFEKLRESGGDNKLGLGQATIVDTNHTITVNVSSALAIGATVTFVYDTGAIDRRNAYSNHDLATTLQLTYKFF
jgi:hypothetical protein